MRKTDPDKMTKEVRFLYEFSLIKNLSPEKLAPFIGVGFGTIYRWFNGKTPLPAHKRLISEGIEKIKKAVPGDTPDGLVRWRAVEVPEEEKILQKKLDVFFNELITKTGPGGRSIVIKLAYEHFSGFEEIVHLAKKLKVKLPEI